MIRSAGGTLRLERNALGKGARWKNRAEAPRGEAAPGRDRTSLKTSKPQVNSPESESECPATGIPNRLM
jgi:hypothetical protein